MRIPALLNISLLALTLPLAALAHENAWRGVGSIGGGVAWTSDLGEDEYFPIINPITDQFYNYTPADQNVAVGLWELFIGAEWTINPHWGWQMGLGYNETGHWGAKGTFVQGADPQSANEYSYRYDIVGRQLMLENKFYYHYDKAHPYLFLGLGASFNRAYDYRTNVPSFSTFTREYQDHNETNFTYAVGLGFDRDLSKHTRLGLGYRFVDLGKVSLGKALIDTTVASGTLSENHLYASEFVFQLTLLL
jgi:opacity protein-like surface antigen